MPERSSQLSQIQSAIERSGALLPTPGPITAFAFLNPMQALEDIPFETAVAEGVRTYGCQPYLPEAQYHVHLATGRIRREILADVLREFLQENGDTQLGPPSTRFELRLAMLVSPAQIGPSSEIHWFTVQTAAMTQFREEAPLETRERLVEETREWIMRELRVDDASDPSEHRARTRQALAHLIPQFGDLNVGQWKKQPADWESLTLQVLWRVCYLGAERAQSPVPAPQLPIRHRDLLRAVTSEDSDVLVHDVMIRFCASFTDQGLARWTLPGRDSGFLNSFYELFRQPGGVSRAWMRGLAQELERWRLEPLDSIRESLTLLGVPRAEWDDYIQASLMALRGWAGMLQQMETRPDRVVRPVPQGSLIEFLAVRLLLERLALDHLAKETLGFTGPLSQLRNELTTRLSDQLPPAAQRRAFVAFQLAQLLGWSPRSLDALTSGEWSDLFQEIEVFGEVDRRRMLHAAFERSFQARALDAISVIADREPGRVAMPAFQAVFCIDAREESLRRHIEEVEPEAETFGTAGFFGVPIYYRGLADTNFTPLCPVVLTPKHWVVEDVIYTLTKSHRRRKKARQAMGKASHQVHLHTRDIASGAVLTAGFGVLATVPLIARVLFPRLTAQCRDVANRVMRPPSSTRLRLERQSPTASAEEDGIGFTVDEMAEFGERALRDIGLTTGFARIVAFVGHGSFSVNNPHQSVYDCGACTGNAGGPNARAVAAMLNDFRVRDILEDRGLEIPHDTLFLGGLHNTCNDSISFFDLDLLPVSHIKDFEALEDVLRQACTRNAHERCRRFDSAPLNLSLPAAHRHVEGRSQDLAQTRPEFGNATNAMCFVGRRERIRGLYLDRRSFMMSYDPTIDDTEHAILARILAAVVPVCEGINLQYYFSHVDPSGWGCGSKLPHNVTSLLGVMDGAASDLRPGIPWQGVEIHEAMRLLFLIESTPRGMRLIMDRNPVIRRIFENSWAHLAVLDPESSAIRVFRGGRFQPYQAGQASLPLAATSKAWYQGWRDHLDFAVIEAGLVAPQPDDESQLASANS